MKLDNFIKKNNVNSIQMTPSRMQLLLDNIKDIPNFNKLEFTCTEENLIKALIVCNPKRIAIMNTNDVDKKTLLKIDKIFTKKVVYDQK